MTFRSVKTRKRPTWRLPPFGALTAASRMRRRSSIGIGSGLKRRIDRWVNIASPTVIESRFGSTLMASSSVTLLVQQREGARRVRNRDGRRGEQVGAVEVLEPTHAEKPQRDADLVLEQLEDALEARLARRGETAASDTPDADGLGAECDRLDDVRTAHEAAVHEDGGAAADRLDDFGQRRDRTAAVVELAAAVVRDVDALDPMLDREGRVLGRGDALQDERDRVRVLEALDVVPVEPGLELEAGRTRAPGLDEAPCKIALAAAVARRVHGEAEGRVPVVRGAPHPIVHPGVVAPDVELEDADAVGGLGHGLEARVADRRERSEE